MVEVIFTKGLPGCGKSTWAKQWVAENPTGRVRVNKDDLREVLHGGKFSRGNEKMVLAVEESAIAEAVRSGRDVVVDNTHLVLNEDGKNRNIERIKTHLAVEGLGGKVQYTVRVFDVSPEVCIQRDLQRPNSVGQDVIWRWYWQCVAEIEDPYCDPLSETGWPTIPKAIMVDMDGTLCEMNGRGPFEWDKVGDDLPRQHIVEMVNMYADQGFLVYILTGRDGSCEQACRDWLDEHGVHYDRLLIRPTGDNRKDFLVKRELFREHIEGKVAVSLVLDDRPQVIREWRRLGLPVVNVNPIDRDF